MKSNYLYFAYLLNRDFVNFIHQPIDQITLKLIELIQESIVRFETISETEWNRKSEPEKWSKKEILGHLIDSAHNNLRRFIVTQYVQNNKIVYYQNDWVKLNKYQEMDTKTIILLWKMLNEQIVWVVAHIPKEKLLNTCDTGKETEEYKTLEFLIEDYMVHMNHHLNKI